MSSRHHHHHHHHQRRSSHEYHQDDYDQNRDSDAYLEQTREVLVSEEEHYEYGDGMSSHVNYHDDSHNNNNKKNGRKFESAISSASLGHHLHYLRERQSYGSEASGHSKSRTVSNEENEDPNWTCNRRHRTESSYGFHGGRSNRHSSTSSKHNNTSSSYNDNTNHDSIYDDKRATDHDGANVSSKHMSARPSHAETEMTRSSKQSTGTALEAPSDREVIALFGAYGVTGNYFLHLALEAGYHVRALIVPGIEMQDVPTDDEHLTLITGTLNDTTKVSKVLKRATYVVCMMNDCCNGTHPTTTTAVSAGASKNVTSDGSVKTDDGKSKAQGTNPTLDLIRLIYSLLDKRAPSCCALLYQASSMCNDHNGSTPILTSIVKTLDPRKSKRQNRTQEDQVVQWMARQQKMQQQYGMDDQMAGNKAVPFIVTRPGKLWNRPSRKQVSASKSMPGPFPITNVDLAEFSLQALKVERLYNTCPYVVQDGV